MGFLASDELLATFVPIAVFWTYSGVYVMLENLNSYRLHTKADEEKNLVSKRTVVKGVLMQQALQIAVALLVFKYTSNDHGDTPRQHSNDSLPVIVLQFIVAMVVMDTWQYFVHRLMHTIPFLYKHIHSMHHSIIVPYAFGAIYNHPLDGLILETIGGAVSYFASGMSPRTAIFFFSFATIKGVDDHCGLWLPGNLLQRFFSNNSAYHDIHHQLYGAKYNFSQPFFVTWDKVLGTYMPYTLVKRKGGGFHARPAS